MIFTYTLYIVGKIYSDRQLAVIISPSKLTEELSVGQSLSYIYLRIFYL